MADSDNKFIEKMAVIVGLISSGIYIRSHLNSPPVPKCPQCKLPQAYPGERYSQCPRCGQLMDWKVKI